MRIGKPIKNYAAPKLSICWLCAHRNDTHCDAFPDGIPSKFIEGKADHTVPVEGDKNITFEPIR